MGVDLPLREKFRDLTFLNEEHAAKVLKTAHDDVTSAIASFVQNIESLPIEAWAEDASAEGWETKAKQRKQMIRISKLNDICHEVYTCVYEVQETAKRHGGKQSEDDCWKALRENKWDIAKALPTLGLKFNQKPFLREADFAEREMTKAALLNENFGYLEKAGEAPFGYAKELTTIIGDVSKAPAKLVEIEKRDGELERVIVQDAIRTFAGHDHRIRMEHFLNGAYIEFGNYSQGMAHVAAFLLLTLQEDEVIPILRVLNNEVIKGHWEHTSTGFGSNSYVFQTLIEAHHPKIFAHFSSPDHMVLPEVYTRKWFCGLGLHCLDVELVYRFLKNLLERGFEYLMSFGMAVLAHFEERVLETDGIGEIIALMALDRTKAGVTREDQEAILDIADKTDYSADLGTPEELDAKREKLYELHLKVRMERAAAALAEADEDQELCQNCDKEPVMWVDEDEDGMPICDQCRVKFEGLGHTITEW